MVAMVLLGSGVAYAANTYPEGKCSDPLDKDDSLLVEGPSFLGDADEPHDADGNGQWSCINERK